MNIDFTVELDDDEVLTLTSEDGPKTKVRIQVESLTVRGRLTPNEFRPITVGDRVAGDLGHVDEPPFLHWLHTDLEAVVLANMRDDPKDRVSRDAAARLEASDFRDYRHAIMFRAIRSLMLKREKVTRVSISEESRSVDHPSDFLPASYVDSVGGRNADVIAAECLEWMLQRRIPAEK